MTRRLSVLAPLIGIVASLAVCALLIKSIGASPLDAYLRLFQGAFGSWGAIQTTLIKTSPLLLAALGIALPYQAGAFNIGAEGQLQMGAIFAFVGGFIFPDLPGPLHMALALVFGLVGGAIWGFIPGYLKARHGLSEIIVTIMMNYIGIYSVAYFVYGPLRDPVNPYPQTFEIAPTAELPRMGPSLSLHAGILVGLICVVALSWFLWRTVGGFKLRVTGLNPTAALFSGYPVRSQVTWAMAIGGGLAGLGGAIEILGVYHRVVDGFSPGYGYLAIAVALLGQGKPSGVLWSSLFFGSLIAGSGVMQRVAGVPVSLVYIVQSLALLFMVASVAVFTIRARSRRPKKGAADVDP